MTHSVHTIDPMAMTDWMAARGGGLTAEVGAAKPMAYVGSCAKCDEEQLLIKGSVAEYGVRGIYVCQVCACASPYGSNPDALALSAAPPDDDVLQAAYARQRLLHAIAAELCEGEHESV